HSPAHPRWVRCPASDAPPEAAPPERKLFDSMALRTRLIAVGVAVTGLAVLNLPAASATGSTPDLAAGASYLAGPATLVDGHYYELFPGFADFGLTMDGGFALAATGSQDAALTS